MHNPAPRSHREATTRSEQALEAWTQQFVPSQSVGARWRWFLLSGVFIAGALFPVGKISNAANENQKESVKDATQTPIQNDGQTAVKPAVSSQSGKPESLPTTDSPLSPVSTAATDAPSTAAVAQGSTSEGFTPDNATSAANSTPKEAVSADTSDSATPPAPTTGRTATLTLTVDGKTRRVAVAAKGNVFQALYTSGVEIQKLDRVWPDVKTPVKDGLKVRVETVRQKLETRDEALAPGFRVQLTSRIAPGNEQVVQWGKSGATQITEKVVYVGGKRVRKAFVSSKVAVPAQDKVIAVGVDSRFLPQSVPYHKRYARAFQLQRQMSARGGSPRDRMGGTAENVTLRPVKTFLAHTSGYAAGPAGGSLGNYTATGMRCVRGAVATDPRIIPLGTKLYIEGYGYAFACDTGGAIKGNRIDLAFNSVGECYAHGRRTNRVWILAE